MVRCGESGRRLLLAPRWWLPVLALALEVGDVAMRELVLDHAHVAQLFPPLRVAHLPGGQRSCVEEDSPGAECDGAAAENRPVARAVHSCALVVSHVGPGLILAAASTCRPALERTVARFSLGQPALPLPSASEMITSSSNKTALQRNRTSAPAHRQDAHRQDCRVSVRFSTVRRSTRTPASGAAVMPWASEPPPRVGRRRRTGLPSQSVTHSWSRGSG